MIIHENETTIQAIVKQIIPSSDGFGQEVELEVLGNESPEAKLDFLKPKAGDQLKVFDADRSELQPGARIQARLGLLGGPFGQRIVLRSAERAPVKP